MRESVKLMPLVLLIFLISCQPDAGSSNTESSKQIGSDTTAPVNNNANPQFTESIDSDGAVTVTWTAFSDANLNDHQLTLFSDSSCTTVSQIISNTKSSANSASISIASDGQFYVTVTAYDKALNSTTSDCSTDSVYIDSESPVDNGADLQFTNAGDTDGNTIAVTWTAFTDANLVDHRLYTYTDSSCTSNETNHGETGSSANSNSVRIHGLSVGYQYWGKVVAIDIAGNETASNCSTDSIYVDNTAPVDNGTDLQFTNSGDNDGNDIAVTWTAFTDVGLTDHRLKTYTNSSCSTGEIDHGLTGSANASDSAIIDGLSDGNTYFAKVTAVDSVGNTTESSCSTDSIIVDTTAPTDNTANLQFSDSWDLDGNDVAVTWTAFTDTNLANHQLYTYTDSSCSSGETNHGYTSATSNSNSTIIDGLTDGTYYAKIIAIDIAGNTTISACSTDSIQVDISAPTDNTASLQFTNTSDTDGNDIAVTWTAFTDTNLSDHGLLTYTNSTCTSGETNHGLTSSSTNSDSAIIDGLADGTYYGKVVAYDSAGNGTVSACSSDSILVDSSAPTDNTANLQFTTAGDQDGNSVAVTWTAFTDTNLSDHRVITYTNSGCSLNALDHGLTSSTSASATLNGLTAGNTYYATVTAYDSAGQSTVSACSSDSIIVDSTAPTDNTANLQFTAATDLNGDNVAVTWTAFTDTNLSNHRLITFTNSGCTAGENDHGYTGATINSNSTIIDGLDEGTFYGKVAAYDVAGNVTYSACSSDSIIVNKSPVDNGANLQFSSDYDVDGNNIVVTWTAFTDSTLSNHRVRTYTDSGCSIGQTDHGLTGSSSATANISGLANGTYYAEVIAVDGSAQTTTSSCSTDTIVVDTSAPTDNTANLQFTDAADTDGNDIAITWTAFTDNNAVTDHQLKTYTNSACSSGETDHGLTNGSSASDSTIVDGLANGQQYWATVTAFDAAGNSTTSSCSSDSIIIDTTAPVDNVADLQFTSAYDSDGNNLSVTWTAFSDSFLSDHRIYTYTDGSCSAGVTDHGLTSSASNSDSAIIDGLADGQYWAKVTAYDSASNSTTSACSTDSIYVDSASPTDNTANLLFTDANDNDGHDIAVTWTAFTDTTLTNHNIKTYTNSGCSLNEVDHGYTNETTNSNSTIIDGLTPNTYYATVTARDALGRETTSACSTDSIVVLSNVDLDWDYTTYDYGSVSVNSTQTYTLTNNGNDTSGTMSITLTPTGDVTKWTKPADTCDTNTLAAGASCTVQIQFVGASGASGSFAATLEVSASPGGSTSISLTGTKP